jgi:uncharacterized protein (DUF736 family)
MIIGNFEYDQKKDLYKGDIVTLTFERLGVVFSPVEKKTNDKEPDYRIHAIGNDHFVELGAAWKRTSEGGKDFLSVSLDGPLLEAPFNAALFKGNGRNFELVWNRTKANSPSAKHAA